MIGRISELIGSASKENWSGIINMPDYGKIIFKYKPK